MEAVLESQEQLQALFMKRMDSFQAQLQSSTPAADSTLATEFSDFRTYIMTAMKCLQSQISLLAREVDNLETRTRRKMLLLHGVAEEKSEDTVARVVKVMKEQLQLTDVTTVHISRCHRMGRVSLAQDKPRPILVKLRDQSLRDKAWFAKTMLKGTGITLSEFLTKIRHDTFMTARQRFGVDKCWTRDGCIFVLTTDGKRHRIRSTAELDLIEAPIAPATSSKGKLLAAAKKTTASAPVSKPRRKPTPAPK